MRAVFDFAEKHMLDRYKALPSAVTENQWKRTGVRLWVCSFAHLPADDTRPPGIVYETAEVLTFR